MRIPLSRPDIGDREIDAVTKCLRSGWLSLGPLLEQFEARFAEYIGTRFAIAISSGTAALHTCVKALGVGAGDSAITTSFSFVASTNCLLYENASPTFAEIDLRTLNIDPDDIRRVIARDFVRDSLAHRWVHRRSRNNLQAILPVHIFGLACDMEHIVEIAHDFDLHVIEDACEALGAECNGRRVGTFGDAAVFAFYPNKQMTTGEGGMIVTNDEPFANRCRSLRNQGRVEDRGWLLHSHLGYNYRLSELQCALGLVQLERIDELLSGRERVANLYSDALGGLPGIELPHRPNGSRRSWFTYVVRLHGPFAGYRRTRLMDGLHTLGIDCRPYFPAIHRQPYFRALHPGSGDALPKTESAANGCLALPFFPSMTAEEVQEVCAAIRKVLAQTDESAGTSDVFGAAETNKRGNERVQQGAFRP